MLLCDTVLQGELIVNAVCRRGIAIGIVAELALLSLIAIRSSVRVADSIDLRLVPLNEDRAFVANMLVRAAFEMGANTAVTLTRLLLDMALTSIGLCTRKAIRKDS